MTTTHQCRILVVDDQEVIRRGLRTFVELSAKWLICGEAANGREATAVAPTLNPDVILMDISMPEVDGVEATREIRKTLPRTPILILSMYDSRQLVDESFRAGASGYMLKQDLGRELVHALEAVSRGERFLSPGLVR